MKPEKLLHAMNNIEDTYLREAREAQTTRPVRRRIPLLIAAVLTLTALTLTALATQSGWLQAFFAGRAQQELSPGQITYIEQNEQIVAQREEHSGYTLEFKSHMSGSGTIYVTLSAAAPEGISLTAANAITPAYGWEVTDEQGKPPFSWTFRMEEDGDGRENTANIVMTIEPGDWNQPGIWNLHVDALYAEQVDEAYRQELLRTKYADQRDVMFTSEETARIYGKALLAEGPWDFALQPELAEGVELIQEPITLRAVVRRVGSEDITSDDYFVDTTEQVAVTSVVLGPLDATIRYKCDGTARFAGGDLGWCVTAVMKDGREIALEAGGSTTQGEQKLVALTPIVLEEADHIRFADGTELKLP